MTMDPSSSLAHWTAPAGPGAALAAGQSHPLDDDFSASHSNNLLLCPFRRANCPRRVTGSRGPARPRGRRRLAREAQQLEGPAEG